VKPVAPPPFAVRQRLGDADHLALLMAVSFLPFPTKLLAEAINDTDAERAAVIFYGATLLVISLLLSALWGAVMRDRELLEPEVSEQEIQTILVATTPSLGFYVGVLVLALFAPRSPRSATW
jgi:uncharacterized membrane protein